MEQGDFLHFITLSANVPYIWLALGALFLAIEALGVSGVGFLFAGLGAFTTGLLIHYDVSDPKILMEQLAWFFGTTVIWTAVLWVPLQRMRVSRVLASEYSNILGNTAVVTGGPLIKGQTGHVKWSGTTMKAELDPKTLTDEVPEGADVVVRDTRGIKLIVAPTHE